VFLSVQSLAPLFSLTVLHFVVFFRLLDRKFIGDFKNVLKTVIFSLQVDLQGILFLTVLSNCVFVSPNFDSDFLLDCTKYYSVFF